MATIHFPQTAPIYLPSMAIAFEAVVDDMSMRCEISEEALQDHFGATSGAAAELIRAFKANRPSIEAVARVKLPARLAAGRGLLTSTDF